MSLSHYQKRDRWSTRATEWVLYSLAWSFRWTTWWVPTWTLAGAVAVFGGVLALGIPGFRRRAERNLELVWPQHGPEERRRITRAAGRNFAHLMVEYARLDKVAREIVLDVTGEEHLHAARSAGKGAILVSAHFGNWEAARFAAKRAGCETGIIYRAFNNRYLDRFTLNLIPVAGRPVLHKGRQGMRQLVEHVSSGGFAMILVDQRNSGAPFLDFLGQPAETVTAAATLARRTGAALIPAHAVRDISNRRFKVTFEEPVVASDPTEVMRKVNARIGAWIEAAPEQWFWFHRRWRTTIRSRDKPDELGRGE